jgi:Tfp pilus assembly protein PilE
MKILIILALLALVVYLAYRMVTVETEIELPAKDSLSDSAPVTEEVLMPDSTFKKSTKIISGVLAALVVLLIAAALLM